MSYTINPNAKNKWARNAENTMDLSIETDASSVYLDNGRTLEQEIGEGSMVSNVTTVDTSMSKVIDGTLDGAYESCVFKGKSLVNLIPAKTAFEKQAIGGTSGWRNSYLPLTQELKTNTIYTLFYKLETETKVQISIGGKSGDAFLLKSEPIREVGTHYVQTLLTTKPETSNSMNHLYMQFPDNFDVGTVKATNMVLLEGNYMDFNVPYFEGICDVKMPILMTTGKNLFDYQDFKNTVLSGGATTKYPINLKPNTTYTFSDKTGLWNGGNGYFVDLSLKDENDVLIAKIIDSNLANRKRFTFTTSNSSEYYLFIYQNNMDKMDKASNDFQIEEGSIATPYEPYKTNILHTSEEIVLREVGGVCDTYNPLTGEYVRRIGEVVLDGSEDWIIHNNDHSNRIVFKTSSKLSGYNTTTSIADKIRTSKITSGISNLFGYSFLRIGEDTAAPTAGVFLHLEGELTSMSNVAKLIEWLQANPITVQYELKTPITTIVESLTTPFAYENGHIILESGYEGQSLLPMLEYSTVVNKTGQIESVAKTIQAQEKQLTMLEQMLIQNIINLDYNNTLLALKNEMEEML